MAIIKVGIVGDVHGSKWWKQHFEKINELDKIVVLGDYFDDWKNDWINANQIDNLQEIIDWKKKYEPSILEKERNKRSCKSRRFIEQ